MKIGLGMERQIDRSLPDMGERSPLWRRQCMPSHPARVVPSKGVRRVLMNQGKLAAKTVKPPPKIRRSKIYSSIKEGHEYYRRAKTNIL